MPSATVEKLPHEPIILIQQPEGSNVVRDAREMIPDIMALLDAQPAPCFLVIDVSLTPMRVDQISSAADLSARSGPKDLLHHANLREVVFVTPSRLAHFAFNVLGTTAYNKVAMRVVETQDEALAYCRSQD